VGMCAILAHQVLNKPCKSWQVFCIDYVIHTSNREQQHGLSQYGNFEKHTKEKFDENKRMVTY